MFVDEGVEAEAGEFAPVAGIFDAAEEKFRAGSEAGITKAECFEAKKLSRRVGQLQRNFCA